MSEKAVSTGMVKKWDEVNGVTSEETVESVTEGFCDSGVGPSISRNYMRGVEDMVEQNDNNLDGVINNVETPKPTVIPEVDEKEKQSVIEKLRGTQNAGTIEQPPMRERNPVENCCLERDVV